jgi:hypothetical protein
MLVTEPGSTLLLSGAMFRTRLDGREWTATLGMTAGPVRLLIALVIAGSRCPRSPRCPHTTQ